MKFLIMIILILSLIQNLNAQWQLVWSDEFDSIINPETWTYDLGDNGWGNNELENYTDSPQNSYIENGCLVIEAKKESDGSYTSARLKTQGKLNFKYGKIEAKIKIPMGQGIWPAFWMMGENISQVSWPSCGEIDIMEHINNEQYIHGTIHWADENSQHAMYGNKIFVSDPENWHIYGIIWSDSTIQWYVDNSIYHVANIKDGINSTDEFHNPFFLILNVAIGGNWPGSPDAKTNFPAKMYVDYIRYYTNDGSEPIVVKPPTEEDIINQYGEGGQVVKNYDFSQGKEYWNFYLYNGANGSFNVTNGEANISITNLGTESWNVQINQSIGLIKGHEYELSIKIKSEADRTVTFGVAKNWGDYAPYYYKNLSLTSNYQTFTYNFSMTDETDFNARIFLDMGQSLENITIDYISLKDLSVTSNKENTKQFNYLEIYPNPFNPITTIKFYSLTNNGKIFIYNSQGQIVKTYNINKKGYNTFVFDGSNLSSGIYFLKVNNKNLSLNKKMILLK